MSRKLQGVIGLVMAVVGASIAGSMLMYRFMEFSWSGVISLSVCLGFLLFGMACCGERLVNGSWGSWLAIIFMSAAIGSYLGGLLFLQYQGGPIQTEQDVLIWLACSFPYALGLFTIGILGGEVLHSLDLDNRQVVPG